MKNKYTVFIKKILRKFNSINVILLAMISFLGVKALEIKAVNFELPTGSYKKTQKQASTPVNKIKRAKTVNFDFYEEIPKKNLFRPDRKEFVPPPPPPPLPPPPPPPPPPPKKKLPPPKLKLNGVLLIGDKKDIALISGQFFTSKSRVNIKYQKYRVGELLGNYKVKEIKQKSVVLQNEDNKELITLSLNFSSFKSSGKKPAPKNPRQTTKIVPSKTQRNQTIIDRTNQRITQRQMPGRPPIAPPPSRSPTPRVGGSGSSKSEIPAIYRGGRVYYPKNGSPPPPPQNISGADTFVPAR